MTKKLQLTSAVQDEFNPDTAHYPLMGFRKVDGVRAGRVHPHFHGRSLDGFKNTALNERFAGPEYAGFDGEVTIGGATNDSELKAMIADGRIVTDEPESSLCSLTTGLTNRAKIKKGETTLPDNAAWNLFDLLSEGTLHLPYLERYQCLVAEVEARQPANVIVLPFVWIQNAAEARAWIAECMELTYEGAIFRDPTAMHKSGRATAKANDFWRYKPVSDKDAIVISAYEAMENQNEATTNTRGRTERSAHQENKVGKGTLGGFIALDIETQKEIKVPCGAMKHKERDEVWAAWLAYPDSVRGRAFKYLSLDTGVKDAPRQARWTTWRALADLAIA